MADDALLYFTIDGKRNTIAELYNNYGVVVKMLGNGKISYTMPNTTQTTLNAKSITVSIEKKFVSNDPEHTGYTLVTASEAITNFFTPSSSQFLPNTRVEIIGQVYFVNYSQYSGTYTYVQKPDPYYYAPFIRGYSSSTNATNDINYYNYYGVYNDNYSYSIGNPTAVVVSPNYAFDGAGDAYYNYQIVIDTSVGHAIPSYGIRFGVNGYGNAYTYPTQVLSWADLKNNTVFEWILIVP